MKKSNENTNDNTPKSLTLGELREINKKDDSELTPDEQTARDKSNKDFSTAIGKLQLSGTNIAEDFQQSLGKLLTPAVPKFDIKGIIKPASALQQQKTNILLERMINITEAQNKERDADIHNAIQPRYDPRVRMLYFANTPISIPRGNQEIICKKLFRNRVPVKQPVEKMMFYDDMDVFDLSKVQRRKKLYSAKDALNTLIAKETKIKDLFVIIDKKLWFNEKYL